MEEYLACCLVMGEGLGSFVVEEGYVGIVVGGSSLEEGIGFEGGIGLAVDCIGPAEGIDFLDTELAVVDSCSEGEHDSLEEVGSGVGWMKMQMEVECCVALQVLRLWLSPCRTLIESLAFCCCCCWGMLVRGTIVIEWWSRGVVSLRSHEQWIEGEMMSARSMQVNAWHK